MTQDKIKVSWSSGKFTQAMCGNQIVDQLTDQQAHALEKEFIAQLGSEFNIQKKTIYPQFPRDAIGVMIFQTNYAVKLTPEWQDFFRAIFSALPGLTMTAISPAGWAIAAISVVISMLPNFRVVTADERVTYYTLGMLIRIARDSTSPQPTREDIHTHLDRLYGTDLVDDLIDGLLTKGLFKAKDGLHIVN